MSSSRNVILYVLKSNGIVEEQLLPTRFEVCQRCEGHGKHAHPAFSNGITSDEWYGPDWSDEERETYLDGGYDVACETCEGKRVVSVVDRDRCNPLDLAAYDKQEREYQFDQDCWRAEIARGA